MPWIDWLPWGKTLSVSQLFLSTHVANKYVGFADSIVKIKVVQLSCSCSVFHTFSHWPGRSIKHIKLAKNRICFITILALGHWLSKYFYNFYRVLSIMESANFMSSGVTALYLLGDRIMRMYNGRAALLCWVTYLVHDSALSGSGMNCVNFSYRPYPVPWLWCRDIQLKDYTQLFLCRTIFPVFTRPCIYPHPLAVLAKGSGYKNLTDILWS